MHDLNGPGGPSADTRPVTPSEASTGRVARSSLQVFAAMLPEVGRLVPALVGDPRVPMRTKLMASAALAYVTVPIELLPDLVPGTGIGADDLLVLAWAVRHLIAGAGYEIVRERWTGTDDGFVFLMLLTGVEA